MITIQSDDTHSLYIFISYRQ